MLCIKKARLILLRYSSFKTFYATLEQKGFERRIARKITPALVYHSNNAQRGEWKLLIAQRELEGNFTCLSLFLTN